MVGGLLGAGACVQCARLLRMRPRTRAHAPTWTFAAAHSAWHRRPVHGGRARHQPVWRPAAEARTGTRRVPRRRWAGCGCFRCACGLTSSRLHVVPCSHLGRTGLHGLAIVSLNDHPSSCTPSSPYSSPSPKRHGLAGQPPERRGPAHQQAHLRLCHQGPAQGQGRRAHRTPAGAAAAGVRGACLLLKQAWCWVSRTLYG